MENNRIKKTLERVAALLLILALAGTAAAQDSRQMVLQKIEAMKGDLLRMNE